MLSTIKPRIEALMVDKYKLKRIFILILEREAIKTVLGVIIGQPKSGSKRTFQLPKSLDDVTDLTR